MTPEYIAEKQKELSAYLFDKVVFMHSDTSGEINDFISSLIKEVEEKQGAKLQGCRVANGIYFDEVTVLNAQLEDAKSFFERAVELCKNQLDLDNSVFEGEIKNKTYQKFVNDMAKFWEGR